MASAIEVPVPRVIQPTSGGFVRNTSTGFTVGRRRPLRTTSPVSRVVSHLSSLDAPALLERQSAHNAEQGRKRIGPRLELLTLRVASKVGNPQRYGNQKAHN